MPKKGVYGPNSNAAYWTLDDRKKALELHKTLPVDKVSIHIGCDPRTVWRWISDHKTGKVVLKQ